MQRRIIQLARLVKRVMQPAEVYGTYGVLERIRTTMELCVKCHVYIFKPILSHSFDSTCAALCTKKYPTIQ